MTKLSLLVFAVLAVGISAAMEAQEKTARGQQRSSAPIRPIVWPVFDPTEATSIAGTPMLWRKPCGFEEKESGAYVHAPTGARVAIERVDEDHERVLARLTSVRPNTELRYGVVLGKVAHLLTEGGHDPILVLRWAKDVTFVLRAIVPRAHRSTLGSRVLRGMLSLEWKQPFDFRPMSFSFAPTPGLRVWTRFGQWSLKCSASGRGPISGVQSEFLVEEIRMGSAVFMTPRESSVQSCLGWRIARLAREPLVEESRVVEINGMPGLEVVARARIGGVRVVCYQVILVTDILSRMKWDIYGHARYASKDEWLPRFRKMARSFKEKSPLEPGRD